MTLFLAVITYLLLCLFVAWEVRIAPERDDY